MSIVVGAILLIGAVLQIWWAIAIVVYLSSISKTQRDILLALRASKPATPKMVHTSGRKFVDDFGNSI